MAIHKSVCLMICLFVVPAGFQLASQSDLDPPTPHKPDEIVISIPQPVKLEHTQNPYYQEWLNTYVPSVKEYILELSNPISEHFISDPVERSAAAKIVAEIRCYLKIEAGHVVEVKMWFKGPGYHRHTSCRYDGNPDLLANLVHFPKLHSLYINCGPCTDVDLCWLSQLDNLETVSLYFGGSWSFEGSESDQLYSPMTCAECLAWLPAPDKVKFTGIVDGVVNSQTQFTLKRFKNLRSDLKW